MGYVEGATQGQDFHFTLGKEIYHVYGTTATTLLRPDEGVMVLHAEVGDWRIRPGDYIQKNITAAVSGTDLFTSVGHGYVTGNGPYALTGTTLPAGVTAGPLYWIIKNDNDTFKLATTNTLALAGTAIDITTNGTPGDWKIGGMPAALAVGAANTAGTGAFKLALNDLRIISSPTTLTVVGFGTNPVLTYWFV